MKKTKWGQTSLKATSHLLHPNRMENTLWALIFIPIRQGTHISRGAPLDSAAKAHITCGHHPSIKNDISILQSNIPPLSGKKVNRL